jgi:hypothetical protein
VFAESVEEKIEWLTDLKRVRDAELAKKDTFRKVEKEELKKVSFLVV